MTNQDLDRAYNIRSAAYAVYSNQTTKAKRKAAWLEYKRLDNNYQSIQFQVCVK